MLKGTSHLITDLLKHDSKTIPAQFWRDPAISYAESRRACCSRTCYKPHSHPTFPLAQSMQAEVFLQEQQPVLVICDLE